MNDVPILETDRLILRGHELEDFADCVTMWADPFVTRYIGGKPSTEHQTWMRVLNYAGHWKMLGFGYWAVQEKTSGQYIGGLGFADFTRPMDPSIHGIPELGWALAFHAHGKGYATEALKRVIKWGDAQLRVPQTVCLIDPENIASIRVAMKCGYRESLRATIGDASTIVFNRLSAPPCP